VQPLLGRLERAAARNPQLLRGAEQAGRSLMIARGRSETGETFEEVADWVDVCELRRDAKPCLITLL